MIYHDNHDNHHNHASHEKHDNENNPIPVPSSATNWASHCGASSYRVGDHWVI